MFSPNSLTKSNILKTIILSLFLSLQPGYAQNIPNLNAVFIPLPPGITSSNPNTIVKGIKTAFSISADSIPVSSRNFDDSITLTDSTGMAFNIDTEVVSTEINFPSNPSVNFLFNTDNIPTSVAPGSGTITIKSLGVAIANVTVNIIESDILNPDSANFPSLKRFKLRRDGRKIKLLIKGEHLLNKRQTSFSTIPSSSIKRIKIKTNKKGKSRMVARFSIPDKDLSRVIFTISTPFGQVIEKIKLADPAFRKEKED